MLVNTSTCRLHALDVRGHDKVLLISTVCMSCRSPHIRVATIEALLPTAVEAHLAVIADQPGAEQRGERFLHSGDHVRSLQGEVVVVGVGDVGGDVQCVSAHRRDSPLTNYQECSTHLKNCLPMRRCGIGTSTTVACVESRIGYVGTVPIYT